MIVNAFICQVTKTAHESTVQKTEMAMLKLFTRKTAPESSARTSRDGQKVKVCIPTAMISLGNTSCDMYVSIFDMYNHKSQKQNNC